MKSKKMLFVAAMFTMSLFLAGCATGLTPSSWPGMVADDERVYVASGPSVYAVDSRDGTELWRFPEKGNAAKPFYAAPVLTPDGQMIVGGYDHNLYSLDPENGTVNWQYQSRDRWIGNVLVANNLIYAPNADYTLYAFDYDGKMQWSYKASQSLWSAPVSDGQYLYFGSLDRRIYCLSARTGDLVWKTDPPLDGAILSSPVFGPEQLLYVSTFTGTLYALDESTGGIRWQYQPSGWLWSGPAVYGENIYFGDSNGEFYSLIAVQGKESWQKQLSATILGTPLFINDLIVIGSESGSLYALDQTGEIVWDKILDGKIYGQAVSAGDLIIVTPIGGSAMLIALDQNGVQQWTYTPVK